MFLIISIIEICYAKHIPKCDLLATVVGLHNLVFPYTNTY